MKKINEILKNYPVFEIYNLKNLNNLLDKQIIKKEEYRKNGMIASLIYNDYGAYLRIWQNGVLECNLIRIK